MVSITDEYETQLSKIHTYEDPALSFKEMMADLIMSDVSEVIKKSRNIPLKVLCCSK